MLTYGCDTSEDDPLCEQLELPWELKCTCRTDLCNGEPGWNAATFKGLKPAGPAPGSGGTKSDQGGTESDQEASSDGAMMTANVVVFICAIIAQLI